MKKFANLMAVIVIATFGMLFASAEQAWGQDDAGRPAITPSIFRRIDPEDGGRVDARIIANWTVNGRGRVSVAAMRAGEIVDAFVIDTYQDDGRYVVDWRGDWPNGLNLPPQGDGGANQTFWVMVFITNVDVPAREAPDNYRFASERDEFEVRYGWPVIEVRRDGNVCEEIAFGNVQQDQRATITIVIRNIGQQPMDVTDVQIGDENPQGQFTENVNNGFVLQPNSERQVNVTFEPTEVRNNMTATLVIESNAHNHPVLGIALSGNGVPEEENISVLQVGQIYACVPEGQRWQRQGNSNVYIGTNVSFGVMEDNQIWRFLSLGAQSQVTVDRDDEELTIDRHQEIGLSVLNGSFSYSWEVNTQIRVDEANGLVELHGTSRVSIPGDINPVQITMTPIANVWATVNVPQASWSGRLSLQIEGLDPLVDVTVSDDLNDMSLPAVTINAGVSISFGDLVRFILIRAGGNFDWNVEEKYFELGADLTIASIEFGAEEAVSYTWEPLAEALENEIERRADIDIIEAGFSFRFDYRQWRLDVLARSYCQFTVPFESVKVDIGLAVMGGSWVDVSNDRLDFDCTGALILGAIGFSGDVLGVTVTSNWDVQELIITGRALRVDNGWVANSPEIILTRENVPVYAAALTLSGGNLPSMVGTMWIYDYLYDPHGNPRQQTPQVRISDATAQCYGWPIPVQRNKTFTPTNTGLTSDSCRIDWLDRNGNVCRMPLTFSARVDDEIYRGHTTGETLIDGVVLPANADYYITPDGGLWYDDVYAGLCRRVYPRQQGGNRIAEADEEVVFDPAVSYPEGNTIAVPTGAGVDLTVIATNGDRNRRIAFRGGQLIWNNWGEANAFISRAGGNRYLTANIPSPDRFEVTFTGGENFDLFQVIADYDDRTATFLRYEVAMGDEEEARLAVDGNGDYEVEVGENRIGPVEDEIGIVDLDLSQLAVYRQHSQWDEDDLVVEALTTLLEDVNCYVLWGRQLGRLDQRVDMELVEQNELEVWQARLENCSDNALFCITARTADGDSVITEIRRVSPREQDEDREYDFLLHLERGWNMISVPLEPAEVDITALFGGVGDAIIIIKDYLGRFWILDWEFNNIPRYVFTQGYQVKTNAGCLLGIDGEFAAADTPIQLPFGWSMVAYFPEERVAAPDAFTNLGDNLLLAKDVLGRFYAPALGFSNMGNLRRGQGYQVKLGQADELVWHVPEGRLQNQSDNWILPVHFSLPVPTGSNMSILIIGLPAGAEAAVSDKFGRLVGSGVANEQGMCGIAVWADDPTTEDVDGAREGEQLSFNWFDGQEEQPLQLDAPVNFQVDGLMVVRLSGLALTLPSNFRLYTPYPNPFNLNTIIRFDLPGSQKVSLAIYDLTGRRIVELAKGGYQAGSHAVTFNASDLACGMYLIRFESGQYSAVRKLVLIK